MLQILAVALAIVASLIAPDSGWTAACYIGAAVSCAAKALAIQAPKDGGQ